MSSNKKSPSALSVSDLSYRYTQKPVLKNISFELTAGRFYALLGPNGAGKSTLFSLLSQLLRSRDGRIVINGYDLEQYPRKAMASVGIVFQQSTLDLDLSVKQNLLYHASLHGIGTKEANLRINRELARFQLTERQHDKVRALNGGHRRRVEIARALLHQPALLLLDEASVGLDLPTRESINAHIRALCDEADITVLSSTHLIDEITVDDHLLVISNGELLLDQPCADALAQHQIQTVTELYQHLTGAETES